MYVLGQKLRFSCTIYYARQFDLLRKRCGIHSAGDGSLPWHLDIVRSLERCVGWDAEGGKSKSRSVAVSGLDDPRLHNSDVHSQSFLKTEDDRYIIKTLVNAWNVADL